MGVRAMLARLALYTVPFHGLIEMLRDHRSAFPHEMLRDHRSALPEACTDNRCFYLNTL